MSVNITDKPFSPEALQAEFRANLSGDTGAITAFTGVVRGGEKGDDVQSLILSHYPDFTEGLIEKMGEEAMKRWPITAWHVTHRVGEMQPLEPIVFVVTASKHRRASFEAADFLMDYLKSEAPFWKQEQRSGAQNWIEPRAQDIDDKARWLPKKTEPKTLEN